MASYGPIVEFARATGVWPNLIIEYLNWNVPFDSVVARLAWQHQAELLIQMQPIDISIGAIAAGEYDNYLRSFAKQVRIFRHAVVVSFAHEMNGTWYSWGAGHVPASTWVAAWRKVVTVFRQQGATNVTWLWTIHHTGNVAVLRSYWPGGTFVNWVGIDGYEQRPSDSFTSVFSSAVRAVGAITPKPILLSEVGVSPGTKDQAKDITSLFAGVVRDHLLGLAWFDVPEGANAGSQDWRLEGDASALAAFRCGIRREAGGI